MVDKMVEVALEYVTMSLLTVVVVDSSLSMSPKTITKSVSLTADFETEMIALSLWNAAELSMKNVPMMMVLQLVRIPMFVVLMIP